MMEKKVRKVAQSTELSDVRFQLDASRVFIDYGMNNELILVVRDVWVEPLEVPILTEDFKEWMLERDMGAACDEIMESAIERVMAEQTAGIFKEIATPML
jgi:hypothetical protein